MCFRRRDDHKDDNLVASQMCGLMRLAGRIVETIARRIYMLAAAANPALQAVPKTHYWLTVVTGIDIAQRKFSIDTPRREEDRRKQVRAKRFIACMAAPAARNGSVRVNIAARWPDDDSNRALHRRPSGARRRVSISRCI